MAEGQTGYTGVPGFGAGALQEPGLGGAAVRDAEAYQKTLLLCCLLLTIPQRKSQFECVRFDFYSFFFFLISILKCP